MLHEKAAARIRIGKVGGTARVELYKARCVMFLTYVSSCIFLRATNCPVILSLAL